ncbi:MAG TPA: hypothetical protein VN937_08410 [Blastocatellia bacterium]|nr:hypothetical protein [Blastocatellia bacterium]
MFFAGVLRILFPTQLPSDSGQFLLLAAFVGLVSTPFSDRLAKKYFHHQVIKTGFYERFISSFLKFYNISCEKIEGVELVSFSGKLNMENSRQAECALEAYKIFSRQGWGKEEEQNRVRNEKSFGILYFSLFCYSLLGELLCLVPRIANVNIANTITGKWYVDALLFLALMLVSLWESTARFRMSLNNETLILSSHFKELKESYDGLISRFLEVNPN